MSSLKEATSLYLDIDKKRLLKELPSFFQSFTETLSELVQNAYRANASCILIEIDADHRILKVTDDGTGASDPSTLITAGKTGWDEAVVTDPAGLGFFALLGCADQVTVETRAEGHHGWRMELTQDAFEGKPITYQPLEYDQGPHPRGMIITAKINSKSDIDSIRGTRNFEKFRHIFPIEVTVHYTSHGTTDRQQYPYPDLSSAPCLETSVGKLYRLGPVDNSSVYYSLRHGYFGHDHPDVKLIWEYRSLSSDLARDLARELREYEGGTWVADAMKKGNYYFVISSESGVRPKLPDRREVIVDNNYSLMVKKLAAAIMAEVDVPAIDAQVARLELPQIIEKQEICQVRIPLAGVQTGSVVLMTDVAKLMLGGYRECDLDRFEAAYINGCWDDYNLETETDCFLAYKPMLVTYDATAQVLCRNGIPATADAEARDHLFFRVDNPKIVSFSNICYGTCDKIELVDSTGNVVRTLSSLICDGEVSIDMGDGQEDLRPYVRVGDAHEFLVERSDSEDNEFTNWAVAALYDAQELCDYLVDDEDSNYGGVEIDKIRLHRECVSEFATFLYADRGHEFKRWEQLCLVVDNLRDLQYEIRNTSAELERFVKAFPEVTEATAVLDKLQGVQRCSFSTDPWKPKLEPVREEEEAV